MALDRVRHQELDHMVRRMSGIVSVFEVRSDNVGDKRFKAFRTLMDAYLEICAKALKQDQDFVETFGPIEDDDRERIKAAFEQVFGVPPSAI